MRNIKSAMVQLIINAFILRLITYANVSGSQGTIPLPKVAMAPRLATALVSNTCQNVRAMLYLPVMRCYAWTFEPLPTSDEMLCMDL